MNACLLEDWIGKVNRAKRRTELPQYWEISILRQMMMIDDVVHHDENHENTLQFINCERESRKFHELSRSAGVRHVPFDELGAAALFH